jgi:MFS family permease
MHFRHPAFSSLIPSIVSEEELRPALALNSIQFNLSRVLGPAIAGLVMVRFGYLWCFGANTGLVHSIFPVDLLAAAPGENVSTQEADFGSGIADIRDHYP